MCMNNKNIHLIMGFLFLVSTGCYYNQPASSFDNQQQDTAVNNDDDSDSSEDGNDRRRRRRRRSRGGGGGGGGGSGDNVIDFLPLCDREDNFQQAVIDVIPDKSACGDISEADINSIIELRVNRSLSALTLNDLADFNSLQRLHLNNTGLERFSENLFSQVAGSLKLLNLSGNDFSALPADIFSDLTNLLDLDLSDSGLTSLPANLFSRLSSLEILYLNDNSLNSLSNNIFRNLSNLEELDLSNNNFELADFTEDALRGLSSSLVEINLSDNSSLTSGNITTICNRLKSLITSDLDVDIAYGSSSEENCSN